MLTKFGQTSWREVPAEFTNNRPEAFKRFLKNLWMILCYWKLLWFAANGDCWQQNGLLMRAPKILGVSKGGFSRGGKISIIGVGAHTGCNN